ncbi:MAG: hypothetical protein IT449_15340 [Phycisphaerales bacterium]|nr:hypothetical protein [Phycisphaerales bacterium]
MENAETSTPARTEVVGVANASALKSLGEAVRLWREDTEVFWIGGAADKAAFFGFGPHHHLRAVMTRWQNVLAGRHSYWGYHELNEIVAAARQIRVERPDAPIVFIGHSFGGATALRAARRLEGDASQPEGRTVDLLITLDAVWPTSIEPPHRAACWVNVHPRLNVLDTIARTPFAGPPLAAAMSLLAADSGSDIVATVGRQLGAHPAATLDVEGPFHHGQSSAMLRAALEAYGRHSGERVLGAEAGPPADAPKVKGHDHSRVSE